MPIELSKKSAFAIESLPKEETVFFFPVGPLEDHGPHLPVGLDVEVAEKLCFLAAQRLEREKPGWVGVIMPKLALGLDSHTTRFALTVRPHVLRDWLVDACRGLVDAGFRSFVCFSGQLGPKQMTAIEEAGKLVGRMGRWRIGVRRPILLSASSAFVSFTDVLKSPFWSDPQEHGGMEDTSIALELGEGVVGSQYRSLPPIEKAASRWITNLNRRRKRLGGYWGKPSEAHPFKGQKWLEEKIDLVFPRLRAVWEGASPRVLFRSWYSILPPNKSFFRSWVLFFLVFLCLFGWGFLNSMSLYDLGP